MRLESSGLSVKMPGSLPISKWRKNKKSRSSFDTMPGEIRNQIFQFYIQNALKPTGAVPSSTTPLALQLSILPQWSGPARMRMSDLGPLPLLRVNKRAFNELASLIYSHVDNLSIGGYMLQHRKDDPTLRWNLIHPLLRNPYISQFTKSIKIKLPTVRDDVHRRYCNLRGFSVAGFRSEDISPGFEPVVSVIPGLVECLKNFPVLSSLEITVTAELIWPPDLEPLLPLYGLCGPRTTVVFVDPVKYSGVFRVTRSQWLERWDVAWMDCLIRNGRERESNFG